MPTTEELPRNGCSVTLLRDAVAQLSEAPITTLHGFCSQVLKTHYARVGLPPDFSVLEETRAQELLEHCAQQTVFDALENGDMAVDALCRAFGGDDASVLPKLLSALYQKVQALPDPEGFCNRAAQRDELESFSAFEESPLVRGFMDSALRQSEAVCDKLQGICARHTHYGNARRAGQVEEDIRRVRDIQNAIKTGMDIPGQAAGFQPSNNAFPANVGPDAPYRLEVTPLHESLKASVAALKQNPVCMQPLPTLYERECIAHGHVCVFMELLAALRKAYARAKSALGAVDFSDMEHFALQALAHEDVRDAYRQQFQWVCIDEYQDINPVQEALIEAVSRGGNLFMVGDVKQSIYAFRHADPSIFTDKYTRFSANDGGTAVDMNANYRSAPAVIQAINTVFERLMRDGLGGVAYDERAALRAERQGVGGAHLRCLLVESQEGILFQGGTLSPLENSPASAQHDSNASAKTHRHAAGFSKAIAGLQAGKSAETSTVGAEGMQSAEPVPRNAAAQPPTGRAQLQCAGFSGTAKGLQTGESAETSTAGAKGMQYTGQVPRNGSGPCPPPTESAARYTARMIRHEILGVYLVQDKQTKKTRPARPGDIAILLSAPRGSAGVYERELLQMGVQCATQQQNLLETVEYGAALDLLRVVDNAQQDYPLIGVLRSGVAGLTEEQLGAIRLACPDAPYFYEAVQVYMENGEDAELREKLKAFYVWLQGMRARSASMPLGAFVSYALHESGVVEWVRALPGGHVRADNLYALMDSARRFENHTHPSLASFLNYLGRTGLRDAKAAQTGGGDAVRILSMHAAKGLEFPIVILPNLHRSIRFNTELPLMDGAMGVALPYKQADPPYKSRSLLQRKIAERHRENTLSEALRLLYVAMTRARDHLVCVAPMGAITRYHKDARARIRAYGDWGIPELISNARSELDLLLYALSRAPMGKTLRQYARTGAAENLEDGGWAVRFVEPGQLPGQDATGLAAQGFMETLAQMAAPVDTESTEYRRVLERVSWQYAHAPTIQAKRSVSELAARVASSQEGTLSPLDIPPASAEHDSSLNVKNHCHATGFSEAAEGLRAPQTAVEAKSMRSKEQVQENAATQLPKEKPSPGLHPGGTQTSTAGAGKMQTTEPVPRNAPPQVGQAAYDAVHIGNILHTVMQQIDFQKTDSPDAIREELERLQSQWYLAPEQISVVDAHMLHRFFLTDLGKRMCAAKAVRREQPFHLVLRGEHARRYGVAEGTLVQGVMDCVFLENDAYVLLDYKSGRPARSTAEIPAQYIVQLRLYALALTQLTGMPVGEAHLIYLNNASGFQIGL